MTASSEINVSQRTTTSLSGHRQLNPTTIAGPDHIGCITMSSSWSQSHSYPPSIPEGVIPAPGRRELLVKALEPSGLEYTWRLWRHCCCRYGWYPLLVAPLVTAGCILSIYTAYGCDFVRVEIGFIPSNGSWNASSSAEFGMFSYQSGELDTDKYREAFLNGCRLYPDRFSEIFIDGDRTWKVARMMAYVSGIASLVGTVTSFLFIISPLPAFFFWPGILMPSLVVAFLSEGSKFLLFDASMCRSKVWFPAGSDSLPQVAESCSLGSTSFCCIAAAVAFIFSLLLVCLKVPTKRFLDSDYGIRTLVPVPGITEESPTNFRRNANETSGEQDTYSEDPDFCVSRVSSIRDDRSEMQFSAGVSRSSRDYSRYDAENPVDCTDSLSGHFSANSREHHNLVSERLKSLDGNEDRYSSFSHNTSRIEEGEDDSSSSSGERSNPTKTNKNAATEPQDKDLSVSESRLHTAERLRLSALTEYRDLIERFVEEVNKSFATTSIRESRETDDVETNERQHVALRTSQVCKSSHSY